MTLSTVVLLVLATTPTPRPKIVIAPSRAPAATRERMIRQLDALAHCRPVDEPNLHITCVRAPDGTIHHTEHLLDGGLESELFISPDLDGTVKTHPLSAGNYQHEERFTWDHAPEVVVLDDTRQRGWFDHKTEWTLDASRSRAHGVASVVQDDGTWKVVSERDASAREVSQTPMPLLAVGDPSRLFTDVPRPSPSSTGYLADGLQRLLAGGSMDIDNDGTADLTPLDARPSGLDASRVQSMLVRGFDGEGTLMTEGGAPYQYIEEGHVLLRWHRLVYSQVSADGHFEQRRVEVRWPWQAHAFIREERDLRHNGHWELVRAWTPPGPILPAP